MHTYACRVAIAAVVTAVIAPMTSANADPGDTLRGGCGFYTDNAGPLTSGTNEGVIYDLSVSQEASGGPSAATVQCWIDVNGVEQPGTRISATGTAVQATQAQISFTAVDGDQVNECMQVTFADGSRWVGADGTNPDCPAATSVTVPPTVVGDLVDTITFPLIPIVCPIFVTLHQVIGNGVPGVLTIGADGDISVADPLSGGLYPVIDCPPYAFPPPDPIATVRSFFVPPPL
jgi:hypothetical protein